jgi:DNA-directed RNA polymerase subunit M
MEFCPKCGAVLMQKRKNSGCPRCGYASKNPVNLSSSEKINERKDVVVIKEKIGEVLPIVSEKCPKCGHDKAYFWTLQTRGSDESETKFFKCVKCNHTRRDYR